MKRQTLGFGALWEVFWAALKLGLTSFGGPSAHIGYFREEYVGRRKWLTDQSFADLNALCQFLPGPSSSQLGMAIGAKRAGMLGAAAAWAGFTLPSAMLMVIFALTAQSISIEDAGWLQGLKLAAAAIVAQAVWNMAKTLAPDTLRATLALGTASIAIILANAWGQLLPLIICAIVGIVILKPPSDKGNSVEAAQDKPIISRRFAAGMLVLFFLLLILLPLVSQWTGSPILSFIDSFYRAGSLVFGGGHVVLPMLEMEFLGQGEMELTSDQLLAGYGAVQAVPGPLFTYAAYIGASLQSGGWAILYAAAAIIVIFLPAFLLVMGSLPFWETLKQNRTAQAALRGVNAGIVGILLAALYDPIFLDTVITSVHFVIALLLFVLLHFWKRPPWQVVIAAAAAGLLFL